MVIHHRDTENAEKAFFVQSVPGFVEPAPRREEADWTKPSQACGQQVAPKGLHVICRCLPTNNKYFSSATFVPLR